MKKAKPSTLGRGLQLKTLQAAAGAAQPTQLTSQTAEESQDVLIGGHFHPSVRKVLKVISAETGKSIKDLLGEAINELAQRHGKPQPYAAEKS